MLKFGRPLGQAAREWAEKTLRTAGLPIEPGFYQPDGNGGLIPARCIEDADVDALHEQGWGIQWTFGNGEKRTFAGKPWVAKLPEAVGHLGYATASAERDAAELLEALASTHWYIQHGDAGQAASAAFWAGIL
jgi:hypothetical protein